MSAPIFSVIVPLFNKEQMIEATIKSVLCQTEKDFELIIVNDGSTDRSVEIVQSIEDKRIKLINQRNKGVSSARNRGIEHASGEYICFLDADDSWYPNFLQEVLSLATEFPSAKMFCPNYIVKYANRTVHPIFRSVSAHENSIVNDFFEMATGAFWVANSSCTVVKRKEVLQMDRWFPEGETVYEDFDFWIRFGCQYPVAHGIKVCAIYNRETEDNARKQHSNRVVYSKTYMKTLKDLMHVESYTLQQKVWLQEIYDRRVVPYVFSLLITKNKQYARQELRNWKPSKPYRLYKHGLICATIAPFFLIKLVQVTRIKLL